jgi:hypothetical protein
MPMLTKAQLKKAYSRGELEEVVFQVRRYGVIVKDAQWSVADGGRYDGAWRECHVNHQGMGWNFTMHNGDVQSVGHVFAPYIIGIHGDAVTEEENAQHIRIMDYKPE